MPWLPRLNQIEIVTKRHRPVSSIGIMRPRICPRCGRNDVRQSGRHSVGDTIMACFGLAPYRCRACRNRFFRVPVGNGNKLLDAEPVVVPEIVIPPVVVARAGVTPSEVTPSEVTPSEVTPSEVTPSAVTPSAVSSASAEPSSAPSPWPLTGHPLAFIPIAYSILIVSRDPAIRKLMCKLLSRPAYHTHQLGDVGRLPSELHARKVDLLIVDLDEPEQERLEAVATLRGNYPKLSIIALSALSVSSVPGSIVLTKPFRRDLLLASVQEALVEAADKRVPVS
jgi:CheY-like chemotaxis protein